MSENTVRRKAWDLADQIIREFEDDDQREILFEVLAQVFRVDFESKGFICISDTLHSRVRREVDSLFEKFQGPHYREVLYDTLEAKLDS